MKKQKPSWVSEFAQAFYADAVAENTSKGTLGERHTRRIAAQHAKKGLALWRAEQIRKWLAIGGVVVVIAFVVINWR